MNKVTSKNKGCANKKCSPQQNGTTLKKSQPETIKLNKTIDELKVKTKTVNGLVNGVADGKNHIISNKTEIATSHKAEEITLALNTKCKTNDNDVEVSSIEKQDSDTKPSETKSKKSKSKRRSKSENVEGVIDSTDDFSSSIDFDISSIIRDKYKNEVESDVAKQVSTQFETLLIEKAVDEEETIIENPVIEYVAYESELQMPLIMKIIQKDLSEPYSIYTYRYFIHNWPNLCFLAMCEDLCVGAIVCKLDMHRKVIRRGYIAMLAVDKRFRKHGIGSTLVKRAIQEMITGDADEVVLETEITNKPALRLYEALGFVRDKRLFRYYLNGVDALRLKLWLR